jgi:hypothetical protein
MHETERAVILRNIQVIYRNCVSMSLHNTLTDHEA